MSTETLDNMWMPSPVHHADGSAAQRAKLLREMAGSKRGRSDVDTDSVRSEPDVPGAYPRGGGWDTNSQDMPAARPEPDFQINTSALRRAFPDFSQHGSSTEDSIEVGRGYKRSAKNTPNRFEDPPSEDISEALPFSFGKGAKYQLTGTPPIRPRASLNLKNKENVQSKKETHVGSNGSNKSSIDSHRTLVDKHATVESDDSVVLQETKPSALNAQTRSTRFATNQRKQSAGTPAQRQTSGGENNTYEAPATNQSYVIPDMLNITELITGHRQDGTPIFNRSVKARSRFTTPSNCRASIRPAHLPVETVPVPADTKALYVSLQLLQEKVADLEAAKQQSEEKLEGYELEVLQLRSELQEHQAAKEDEDSGLGSDVEDGMVKELKTEKTKLETSLRTLQERLDRANRKVNKSEAHVSTLTKDRDALHAQLGLAYLHAQEDGGDDQVLSGEVQKLRKELSRVTRDHQKRMDALSRQEVELRGKIERREKAINQMASLSKELYNTRLNAASIKSAAPVETARDPSLRIDRLRQSLPRLDRVVSDQDGHPQRSSSMRGGAQQARRQNMRTDHVEAHDSEVEAGLDEEEQTTHIQTPSKRQHDEEELAKDADFMSFMDGDEVEKLRFVVEDEKARLAHPHGQEVGRSSGLQPKKSVLKKVSYGDFTAQSVPASERTGTTRNVAEQREDTQRSAISQASERRRRSASAAKGEMTSAFLVPDVTLRTELEAQQRANDAQEQSKQKTTISRPVPVSDRMPEEQDATVRPAQNPAVALAIVIRDLEDEVSRFRTQLAEQEALYQQHDPSLSKRKRKIVYARIQKLLAAIDTRCDQIYALYDVLEGQKASGQMMKEEEVEVTLQKLGLDAEVIMNKKTRVEDDESDGSLSDDDDFPPWEGMEQTRTQTLENLGRLGVHA